MVIGDLPDVAMAIRKGNEKPVMRLVGEVMKRSKGRADPKEARRILMEILKE
jgi:aspartyl-tRNA(Asn)/glutamyl-tRNA(Gln) amidotransferase subunit B